MKTLILALILLSSHAFAQRSVQALPVDNKGTPLIAGLGLPYLCEVSVSLATYNAGAVCSLPANSGEETGRMYRHIMIYNGDTADSAYVCLGNSTSCVTDMIKVRPESGLAQDFALYGPGNSITTLWVRMGSAGAATVDVMFW